MAELTGTGYAVIGLLSVKSFSTYELAKQVERSLGWFWPRSERKIYDEARHLVHLGLATSSAEMVGKRRRTMYTISDEGRAVLAEWLAADSAPMKLESEALVRVFFGENGTLDDLRSTLTRTLEETEFRLAVLAALVDTLAAPDYPFTDRIHVNVLGLRFQLDHHRAVASWARWALEQTATWASAADAGDWDWRRAFDM